MKLFSAALITGLLCLLTIQLAAQRNLYWSDINQGNIKVTEIGGDGEQDTILQQSFVDYHATDIENDLVYWVDRGRGEIVRAFLDGSDPTVIASGLSNPKGITLGNGVVYFIEGSSIKEMNRDGDFVETVLTGITAPADLALQDDVLYFSDTEDRTIERVFTSGSDRTVLLSGVFNVIDLELDTVNEKIYYAQKVNGGSQRGVWRANFDGTEPEQIVSGSVNGIAVDGEGGFVYWSESIFNTINRLNLSTMEETRLMPGALPFPTSISLDKANGTVYFVDNSYGNLLLRANLADGRNITPLVVTDVYRPDHIFVHASAGKIYWVNTKTSFINDTRVDIMRADLDGGNVETLLSSPVLNRVDGLTIDTINGHLYYTELSRGRVVRANLDGTDRTDLVTGLDNPTGITIDLPNNHVYWTDWGSDKIQRADLDGTNVTDLVTTDLSTPGEIKIYAGIGKIYWTDSGEGLIRRANLDGSELETFAPLEEGSQVGGSSLFVDEANGKVYFFSASSSTNRNLQRADPDGTNVEELVSANLTAPGSLYFVDNGPPSSILNVLQGLPVKVAPNPTGGTVTLSSDAIIVAVRLYGSDGRLYHTRAGLRTQTHRIETVDFPAGLYYGVVFYQDGRATRLKLVRE